MMMKARTRYLFLILALLLALTFSLAGCGDDELPESGAKAGTAYLTINASAYFASEQSTLTWEEVGGQADGILYQGEISLDGTTSVMDALLASGISFVDAGGYVSEISGIGAGATGGMSGWLYTINGEVPTVSAAETILAEGDELLFVYSNDGGADAGISFESAE